MNHELPYLPMCTPQQIVRHHHRQAPGTVFGGWAHQGQGPQLHIRHCAEVGGRRLGL